MNERQARLIAARIESRWPGIIQATVASTAKRWDADKCEVVLRIPRENRVLRLGNSAQFAGMLDVCATLIEQQPISLCTPKKKQEGEKQVMEPINEHEIRDGRDLLNEEEAAAYVGVKANTMHTYGCQGVIPFQQEGLFARADLDAYKSRRKPRAIPTDPAPAPSPTQAIESSASAESLASPAAVRSIAPIVPPASAPPPAGEIKIVTDAGGEIQVLQNLLTHTFTTIPGILGLGRLMEVPRSWKVDVTTVRGPESYRLIRNADGSFRQEPW